MYPPVRQFETRQIEIEALLAAELARPPRRRRRARGR
jgi:hypothetical protein